MALFAQIGDTHFGRRMYGLSLLDDQEYAVNQVCLSLAAKAPTALLLTGDVYDRALPPAEAVELLDRFIYRVAHELQIPIVMIAGNHDSAARLAFGSRLMDRAQLYIAPAFKGPVEPVLFQDEHGPIEVYPIPFLEPARVRQVLDDDSVVCQQSAMNAVMAGIRSHSTVPRKVVMGHAFVHGGLVSDSERKLSLGGAETIDVSVFDDMSYVALGHLHRPQEVGSSRVQYAGSLLKYSTSELNYQKSMTLAEIDGAGQVQIERLPIVPRRDFRRLEGTLEAVLARAPEGDPDDYVVVKLADKGPVFDAMNRLREKYPNALHIEREQLVHEGSVTLPSRDHRKLSAEDLFAAFFEEVLQESMSDEERESLVALLQQEKLA